MTISVYLPCRAGSSRVKNKNTRRFVNDESLLTLKLKTLMDCKSIKEICVSTNDELVIEQANSLQSEKVRIFRRKDELCLSSTKTDDLVGDMLEVCQGRHLIWTHVTSPFITAHLYQQIIDKYQTLSTQSSLMTVTKHQTFLWHNGKPLNYDRSNIKWPNTQTLPTVWEINSGVFMISYEAAKKVMDRIDDNPYLFETNFPANIDIDTTADFDQAKYLYDYFNTTTKHNSDTRDE